MQLFLFQISTLRGIHTDILNKLCVPYQFRLHRMDILFDSFHPYFFRLYIVFFYTVGDNTNAKHTPKGHAVSLKNRFYLPTVFTKTFLCLGPSNSQKYIVCHVPRTSFPSSTITITDAPTRLDFICAAEFPSVWR